MNAKNDPVAEPTGMNREGVGIVCEIRACLIGFGLIGGMLALPFLN